MFECSVTVFLPLCYKGTRERISFEVARYDFDPGLYPEEMVRVNNAPLLRTSKNGEPVEGSGPKFSFDARVLKRSKIIEPVAGADSFILLIELEIADKEEMPEMLNLLKDTFPGVYEDYQPEVDN